VYSVTAPHNNTKAKAKGKGNTKGGKGGTGKGGTKSKTTTGVSVGSSATATSWAGYEMTGTGYQAMSPGILAPINPSGTYGKAAPSSGVYGATTAANNGWQGYEDVNTTGYRAMSPDRAPPVNPVDTYGRTSNGGGGVGGGGGGTTSSDGYEVAQIGRQGGTGVSMQSYGSGYEEAVIAGPSSAPPPAISRGRKQQASGVYGFDSGGNEEDV
jgi:hypothetical protein